MEIPLDYLKTIIALAESPNMIEAAKSLGISQPALSFQLKRLQEFFPQSLFEERGRKKVLTTFGHLVYTNIRRPIQNLSEAVELSLQTQTKNIVRAGMRVELFERVMNRLDFSNAFRFHFLTTSEAISRLERDELDLAISHFRPESQNLICKKLFSEGSKLIISKSSSKDWKKQIKAKPFISYKMGFHSQTPLFQWLGIEPSQTHIVLEDWRGISRMVEEGDFFSIVPEGIRCDEKKVQSIEIPDSVLPVQDFYAVYQSRLRGSKIFKP